MLIVSWVGIALTAISMVFSGIKYVKENPEIVPKIQQVQFLSHQVKQSQFMYSQVNVAYDVNNNKHWFQHPNGQWKDFPPTPSQEQMQVSR